MQIALIIAIAIFFAVSVISSGIYRDNQIYHFLTEENSKATFIVALMSFAAVGAFTVIYNITFI